MKKLLAVFGVLVLILGGSVYFAWNKYGLSQDDLRVLTFVTQSKDLAWGVGAAFKPVGLLEYIKPEAKDHAKFVQKKLSSLAAWAPQNQDWWKDNVSAFATGRMGSIPFYVFSVKGNVEEVKKTLLGGKLTRKNDDGTYTLVAQKDCSQVGPLSVTTNGNIIAMVPSGVKFALPEPTKSLNVLVLSMTPKNYFTQTEEPPQDMVSGFFLMSGAAEAIERLSFEVGITSNAKVELRGDFALADVNKAKEIVSHIENKAPPEAKAIFKKHVTFVGPKLQIRATQDEIQEIFKSQSGDEEPRNNMKPVTEEALAELDRDRELEKPVNYSEAPSPEELFADCKNGDPIQAFVSRWSRNYIDPQGSYIYVAAHACLNRGYTPAMGDADFMKISITDPLPETAVCGIELDANGIDTWTTTNENLPGYRRYLAFGISDARLKDLNAIKGSVTVNLPKKVKRLPIPFVAPYKFDIPVGSGKLIITSSMGWSGVDIEVAPEGKIPVILNVRGMTKQKVYLESDTNVGEMISGFFDDLLGIEKDSTMRFSFRGKLAELEVVYVEESAPKTVEFNLPWNWGKAPALPQGVDPASQILTAETYPKLFQGERDALAMKAAMDEGDKLIKNEVQTSGPFLIDLYRPNEMFDNNIRFTTHADYFQAMEGRDPYKVTIKKAELANGKTLELQPMPEKLEKDDFGRELIPWGHYTLRTDQANGGYNNFSYTFFSDYMKDIDEDTAYPTFLEGMISLTLPQSYEISPLIPLNIMEKTQFAGVTLQPNMVHTEGLELLVEGEGFNTTKLDFIGVSEDGKVSRLVRSKEDNVGDTWKILFLKGQPNLKALYAVKFSPEEKNFEYPFRFGKPRGAVKAAKPVAKKKK